MIFTRDGVFTKRFMMAVVVSLFEILATSAKAQTVPLTISGPGNSFVGTGTANNTGTTITYVGTYTQGSSTCAINQTVPLGVAPTFGCPTTTTTTTTTTATPTTTTTSVLPTGIAQSYYEISSLGLISQNTSTISIGSIHSMQNDIRDRISGNRARGGAGSNSFAWDPFADTSADTNGPFAALGYAKAPIYTKAPPPVPSAVQFAIWGQAFADQEKRSETFLGADVGRTTNTYGGLAGMDAAFTNFLGTGGTWVAGIVGGGTVAEVRNNDGSTARVSGPGVGFYTVYANGAFSTDSVSKVDFFDLNRGAPGVAVLSLGLTNWTSAYNLNYKFEKGTWWIEPTVGASYTSTRWDSPSKALGFQDGEQVRIQGGARVGTSSMWNGVLVEETLTGLGYSDVIVNGGTLATAAGAVVIPTDQGKLFGQGIGKLNFIWTPKLSSYVEGEVRGRQDVVGYAGRVGLRYSFN